MDHDQKTCPLCRTAFIPDDMQESFNERLWLASEGECFVKKEVEAHTAQDEADPPVEPIPLPDDIPGHITVVDLKLDGLRELLLSQQDLIVKVKSVTQKTCTDVAKFRMLLEYTSKDAFKPLKHVFSAL
ncbi:hypothetical protein K7X08_013289 [Anisodus acutangulus]|uniref:Uncharacterized protein n=1 Tax=Anisodus acutangulus TaxID=402998 RepID=A0A9Q1MAS2_9SOLA|nr:hypothetical protein K7X08_013289 [Anisodus acutangulus]